jgi:hypothetical protein
MFLFPYDSSDLLWLQVLVPPLLCFPDILFSQPLIIFVKLFVKFLWTIRGKHVEDVIFEQVAPPTLQNFDEFFNQPTSPAR